ncbi:MAG: GNAT family N-acetyltransferase [Candidatus Bruticola sp.]
MLIYDIATQKNLDLDSNSIGKLWLEAFPEDNESAFQSYFRGRLSEALGAVCVRQQEVASMAFMLNLNYTGSFKFSGVAAFIVGVASAEKWRGQGLSSMVLKFIAKRASLSGADVVMLSTYIPDFYAKLGYQPASWHKLWRRKENFKKNCLAFQVILENEYHCQALADCYNLHRKFGWLDRSAEYWKWRLYDSAAVYALKNSQNQISAYVILNQKGECEEFVGSETDEVFNLAEIVSHNKPLAIADSILNEKLAEDNRFDYLGSGSCQMVLPLKDSFISEYLKNRDNFSCLDNW